MTRSGGTANYVRATDPDSPSGVITAVSEAARTLLEGQLGTKLALASGELFAGSLMTDITLRIECCLIVNDPGVSSSD
jgi:hypothetical protein